MMTNLDKGRGIEKTLLSNELPIYPTKLVYCSNRKLALIAREYVREGHEEKLCIKIYYFDLQTKLLQKGQELLLRGRMDYNDVCCVGD